MKMCQIVLDERNHLSRYNMNSSSNLTEVSVKTTSCQSGQEATRLVHGFSEGTWHKVSI